MPTSAEVITIRRDVLTELRGQAEDFRREMTARGTLVVNLISSPGAGKTALLEATADHWRGEHSLAVLVGDIATDRDAQRLARHAPVVQLSTGGACHLEHPLVLRGWQALGQPQVAFLFIENIGNLVCPASHDLGEHLRVLLLSTTEGDDKPAKYPKAFRTSHALVISKTDLLPFVPFSVERAAIDAHEIQPQLPVFPTSTHPPCGLDAWGAWLIQQREELLEGRPCGPRR